MPAEISFLLLMELGFGLFFIYSGLNYLSANLDDLWKKHEQISRSRGIVNLERTPEWERQSRNNGYFLIGAGVFFLLMLLAMLVVGNQPRRTTPPQEVWLRHNDTTQ